MDEWGFLDPWIPLVTSCVQHHVRPQHKSFDRAARGFSFAPHMWISVDSVRYGQGASTARALALVALALRVDQRVWEKLSKPAVRPSFEWQRFRPEDLELRVEVANISGVTSGGFEEESRVLMATQADDDDRTDVNNPTSAAAFAATMRRIAELDVHGRLVGFQIPVRVVLNPCDTLFFSRSIEMIEWLVASDDVACDGQARPGALYRLVDAQYKKRVPFALIDRDSRYPPRRFRTQLAGLSRLSELGVPITSFVGDMDPDDPTFLDWMARDRPVQLALSVRSDAALRRLGDVGARLGSRLEALTLNLGPDVFNHGGSAASSLAALLTTCRALRYVEFVNCFPVELWNALDHALREASVANANRPVGYTTRSSPAPIQAFTMRRGFVSRYATTHRMLTTLSSWLPSLRSLTLTSMPSTSEEIERGRPVDDACFAFILRSFPLLESLDIKWAELTSWTPLLNAYAFYGCRIRTFGINCDLSCVPLLRALMVPVSPMARTVDELRVRYVRKADEADVVLTAETMLMHNRCLAYLHLRLESLVESELRQRVRRFHRHPSYKALLLRLAFLSVVRHLPAKYRLDADVLTTIFAMVGRRQLRLVEVLGGAGYC